MCGKKKLRVEMLKLVLFNSLQQFFNTTPCFLIQPRVFLCNRNFLGGSPVSSTAESIHSGDWIPINNSLGRLSLARLLMLKTLVFDQRHDDAGGVDDHANTHGTCSSRRSRTRARRVLQTVPHSPRYSFSERALHGRNSTNTRVYSSLNLDNHKEVQAVQAHIMGVAHAVRASGRARSTERPLNNHHNNSSSLGAACLLCRSPTIPHLASAPRTETDIVGDVMQRRIEEKMATIELLQKLAQLDSEELEMNPDTAEAYALPEPQTRRRFGHLPPRLTSSIASRSSSSQVKDTWKQLRAELVIAKSTQNLYH